MINCTFVEKGIRPADKAELKKVEDFKGKLKIGESVAMELYRGAAIASIQQLKMYRSEMLPTAMWFLDELTKYGNDRDAAHYHLKLVFCCEVRPDLATIVNYKGQDLVMPFSLSLNDCSKKNRNEFFKWLEEKVMVVTRKNDWKNSIAQYKMDSSS